ncbi:MAG: membrane protein insertase YidC [Patescibacteria group bacterium]|nr:membrane protein insertase YidC [Patescibacteria group bacterium]
MPGGDVGLAIIVLTLLVRAVFYPVFASSIRTQMALQAVQPEIAEINERYKDDTMERSRRTTEVFRKHRIKPLSLVFATIVQLAIFFSLSYAFFRLGLPHIQTNLLYSFVPPPASVNENFLGILNLVSSGHIVLTCIVVVLQFIVIKLSLARTPPPGTHLSEAQRAAQNMQRQMMLYLFPAVMAFVGYTFPGAVGLYLAATSAVSLAQEGLIRRKPL